MLFALELDFDPGRRVPAVERLARHISHATLAVRELCDTRLPHISQLEDEGMVCEFLFAMS